MVGVSASTLSIPIADPPAQHRAVGRVVRAHGVAGDVAVEVYTDMPRQRFVPGSVLDTDGGGQLVVAAARRHRGRMLVRFDGYDTRSLGERLRGVLLTVRIAERERTDDPDEFPDHELEDVTAVGRDGVVLGTVREVRHAPGHDLLVLDTARGQRLVPFVRDIVPEVDLAARRVVLDPPGGLLDG